MRDSVEILSGGELLLSGEAVAWFATLAERAVNGYRLNGVRSPLFEGWARATADAARRSRTSAIGSAELPPSGAAASSTLADPITASEAAELLGCGTRNVTLMCVRESLATARKVAGQWRIERAEVLARVSERAS